MTRILIADDHPLFRIGLAHALRARGFEVVGEAENGRHAVELCRTHRPELVVLDVRMPTMDGVEACRALRAFPDPPCVVMLTTFDEPAIKAAARDAGAVAYLSKETEPARLAETLQRIANDPTGNWMPDVSVPRLTVREREALTLLADGLSNKEIAGRMGIGPDTAKDYLASVYRKLEVRDRVSAVREAERLGFV
ncbi:MAG: response regulator transcription factor [Trueperaceae bacterium]|nr:response regulator transcription factor [Trueperaceae bacterium]